MISAKHSILVYVTQQQLGISQTWRKTLTLLDNECSLGIAQVCMAAAISAQMNKKWKLMST